MAADVVTLTVDKSKLKFPEAGKEEKGTVTGKLTMLKKTSDVSVTYKVKESGGKYTIDNASFTFDYTKHIEGGEKICLAVVCVKPNMNITISGGTVEVKK